MRVYVRLPSLEEFVVGAKFDSMQAVAEWVSKFTAYSLSLYTTYLLVSVQFLQKINS